MPVNSKWQSLFWFAVRLFIGFVFFYSGFSKVMEPVENFKAVLYEYRLIPHFVAPVLMYLVPWVELILGLFLLTGYAPRLSAKGAILLSGMFVMMLTVQYALTGSFPSDCGCFGEGPIHLSGAQVLLLDIVQIILMTGYLRQKSFILSLDQYLRRES